MKDFIRRAPVPMSFNAANGSIGAEEVVDMFAKEFDSEIEPHILQSTPDVLSVGMRCMKLGYHFIWPAGQRPYFI